MTKQVKRHQPQHCRFCLDPLPEPLPERCPRCQHLALGILVLPKEQYFAHAEDMERSYRAALSALRAMAQELQIINARMDEIKKHFPI